MTAASEETFCDHFSEVKSAFQRGQPVIIVDDEDRENEGDLVVATELLTAESVSFMMREGRGLICVSIDRQVANRLQLPFQAQRNGSTFQTPFAVTVDHRSVQSYGVTARGRAETMKALIDSGSQAGDFVTPGSVFPLIAHPSGVLGRGGQTEGSYDLARLCGLKPSGVICEVMDVNGLMLRGPALKSFAKKHQLLITSVAEIERVCRREVRVQVIKRTKQANYESALLADSSGAERYWAFFRPGHQRPRIKILPRCILGMQFGDSRCNCRRALDDSLLLLNNGQLDLLLLNQLPNGATSCLGPTEPLCPTVQEVIISQLFQ